MGSYRVLSMSKEGSYEGKKSVLQRSLRYYGMEGTYESESSSIKI